MFDANSFLNMSTTEANDTKLVPVPEGEYTAIATEVKADTWQSKADPSKAGLKLLVTWDIDSPDLKQELGRDKITVRQDIMLDTTESGGLDMGKGRNIGLGKLREAVGLNVPGQAFAPSMIQGRAAKVLVKHRVVDDNIYAEVKAVAPMA